MSKEYIYQVLDDLREILSSENLPQAKYDKRRKTITVRYNFSPGYADPVKIIASSVQWLDWYALDFDGNLFSIIEPYLFRPDKKTKSLLQKYAQEWPEDFSSGFWVCVQYALAVNPLYRPNVKARNPSPHDLSWHDRNVLSFTAASLYVFLEQIGKQKEKDLPKYVIDFLGNYNIEHVELQKNTAIQFVVEDVINQYWGLKSSRTWKTFVEERPIDLKKMRASKRITPENNPFLAELFKEFRAS